MKTPSPHAHLAAIMPVAPLSSCGGCQPHIPSRNSICMPVVQAWSRVSLLAQAGTHLWEFFYLPFPPSCSCHSRPHCPEHELIQTLIQILEGQRFESPDAFPLPPGSSPLALLSSWPPMMLLGSLIAEIPVGTRQSLYTFMLALSCLPRGPTIHSSTLPLSARAA